MKKAILKGNAAALVAALCCAVVLCTLLFDARLTAHSRDSLTGMVRLAALGLDESGDLGAQADTIATDTGLRVTIIDADGVVLADSQAEPAALPNHGQREEIQLAAQGEVGISVRNSDSMGKRMMYAATRTPGGLYLRLAATYNGFWLDLAMFWPALVLALVVGVAVAVPVASRQAATITRPIAQLSRQLSQVKQGSTVPDIDRYPYPELRQMAGDINRLSAEVSSSLHRLQEEKAKIDYILDNMSEGFLLLDEYQRVLTINKAACRFFNCRRSDTQGKSLLFATRCTAVLDALDTVMSGREEAAAAELPPDGGRSVQAIISRVTEGQTGLAGGAIIILSDVTDQKNAVKMRQEFFQSASHELKTPITSIRGFAELLCGDLPLDDASRREFSQRILKEAGRMSSLIGDIIMISRLESGDITFEREPIDLADAVKESAESARNLATQSEVDFVLETQPCPMTASRREMSELFGNLMVNAVRYNRPGGRVEAKLTCTNGRAVFSVFNTGEPIPVEYRQRIFERFFRIDKGRSKASGGTGLGLAIVKHIAAGYGAEIRLDVTDEGNRFAVEFP